MSWFNRAKRALDQENNEHGQPARQVAVDQRLTQRAARVNISVQKVAYGTDQVDAATNQLLDVIRSIGDQMAGQQDAVSRASSIIAELGAFAQEVTASVNEVGSSSSQTAETIGQGKEAVRRSTEFIGQIKHTVTDNANAVRKLVDRTMEIDRFVSSIKDIATQTNLLALNAAIEAARAGAEGRGFAVVANEVKKLAENSAESAIQISKLLEAIKSDAAMAVSALQENVQAVAEGHRLVTDTGSALDEIMDSVSETMALVQEISTAVAQQAANNEQLMTVTDSMKDVLTKAALYIETASFDAEQQRASVQTLLKVTDDLRELQQEMQTSIPETNVEKEKLQVYKYGLPQDPVTLDPAMSRDTNSNNVIRELFLGLLQIGQDGRPIPGIAATWHLEDDGRTYTFLLRQDACFHHGRPIEAQDVKFSLERLLRPSTKSPHSGLVQSIAGGAELAQGRANEAHGIRVLGRHKLSITLNSPNLIFLNNLASLATSIVPREIVEKLGDDFARNPVGAGPFSFVHWQPGQEILLAANRRFHEGPPYIDQIAFPIFKGADALLEGFLAGEVSHVRVDAASVGSLVAHPVYAQQLIKMDPVDVQYCALMCNKPPFDNKLVRQAANYAFDRTGYLRSVLNGQAVLAGGVLPPSMLGSAGRGYEYNPGKAKSLMAQAYPHGYSGEAILHVRANNQEQAARAEAIAAALGQIGIRVRVVTLPWTELVKPENMAKCHMFLMGASGGNAEATGFLEPYFHSRGIGKGNRVSYNNPEVDRLLDQAETIANPERRKQVYIKAHQLIVDDAPWMFLFHPINYLARQPHVKGFRGGLAGEVHVKNLWLDQD